MSEPRVNVYTCRLCGGHTITVDVDEGTTPFMIGCRAGVKRSFGPRGKASVKVKCPGTALSSFYPRGPKPPHIGEPAWEWFKPTDTELTMLYKGNMLEQMREHVSKGGLDMRRRTNATPVMHPPLDATDKEQG